MYASTLTGVARFRHSLYAGLWAFPVLLLFIAPLNFLLMWELTLLRSTAGHAPPSTRNVGGDILLVYANTLETNPAVLALGLIITPLVMAAGFVLGGALDGLITATVRGIGSRERWTYHTRDGKSFPVYGPWRNPVLAVGWSVAGWAVLLTCWVPLLSVNILGVVAAVALGQACRTLARKHRALSAKAALEGDRRPPIVYLRSFQADGLFQPGTFFLVNDWLRTLSEKTAEYSLSTALAPFGPVVAIGRPAEEIPEVGAARIYVGDDHWRDLILDLLSEPGALAVIQAGATEGLRWELETVASKLRLEQILMFLPFGLHWSRSRRNTDYAAFRAWAADCSPAELPDAIRDGIYFFYFSDTLQRRTNLLEPHALLPKAHPLGEVLKDLRAVYESV